MKRRVVLLLVTAVLPLVVARVVVETRASAQWRGEMEAHATDHAQAVATLVNQHLDADLRGAAMLAQSPAFDGELDEARLKIITSRLLADNRSWRAMSVSDRTGKRLFDAPAPIAGITHGQAVDLESQQRAVKTGMPLVGNVVVGPRGRAGVAIRAPVKRDGRVIYVLSIIIDPTSFRSLLLADGLAKQWPVRLFDARGDLVVGSDQGSRTMTPSQTKSSTMLSAGIQPDKNSKGETEFAVWKGIPAAGWRIEVAIPQDDYLAPLQRRTIRIAVTVAVGVLLISWFLFLLRRIIREERSRAASAMEAQRLEVLGRMTSGVAHDFNNLLTPIVGGYELLRHRIGDDQKSLQLIDAGVKSAERAKALVTHLLAYSRRPTSNQRTTDIGRLVEDLQDLLRRTLGSKIELRLDLQSKGPFAEVDAVQLELALLNLAINARDAMPEGGTLTIKAVERTSAYSTDLKPGRYARIRVTDTGIGMSAATLKMAREPFFTTKPLGAGTGLGLSMVQALVVRSGGEMLISSELAKGTVIEIWLPATDEPIVEHGERHVPLLQANGRILLVDDDDAVRSTQAEMLREVGYKVIAVATAVEAIDILRIEGHFDLLITDFSMPQMSGEELAWKVRRADPRLPIMLLTGFAGDVGELPNGVTILMKPVRQAALLARVAEVIDQAKMAISTATWPPASV